MTVKKAPHRAQGRRPSLALVPSAVTAVPPVPDGLEPEIVARWRAFWTSDGARLVNWERQGPALSRLFWLYAQEIRLKAAATEPLLEGSKGQVILNPALRHLAIVQTQILALEKEFGWTQIG